MTAPSAFAIYCGLWPGSWAGHRDYLPSAEVRP